jgi:hypothetical protein
MTRAQRIHAAREEIAVVQGGLDSVDTVLGEAEHVLEVAAQARSRAPALLLGAAVAAALSLGLVLVLRRRRRRHGTDV